MRTGSAEHSGQDEHSLVTAARAGDESAFAALVQSYRRELQVHCYRMLGSLTEAEDIVQETYLRAWRHLDSFEGRSTLRTWLYRISTNACLDVLARRRPRLLPYDVAPATAAGAPPPPSVEYLSLEPYPDRLLPGAGEHCAEPGDVVVAKETIELAFLAAIQHLPPRQRAVLILRDVLGWSARQTAAALDMTEVAVKSALQRARPVLGRRLPSTRDDWAAASPPSPTEREVLERYIAAHESDDPRSLAEVLRHDVRVSYPPHLLWRDSREAFITSSAQDAPPGDYRFLPTQANHQPAVAIYLRPAGEAEFAPVALEVLRIEQGTIAEIVDFDLPHLIPAFGLPATL